MGDGRAGERRGEERGRPLDTARLKAVLELAAQKGSWGKPLPAGQGRGIACHYSFHSYVANLIEVTVNKGAVRVNRVVSAVDIGTPVNPDGIRAQVESAIVYGLTAALKSQITIENGRAVESNFNKFTTLSMKEMPRNRSAYYSQHAPANRHWRTRPAAHRSGVDQRDLRRDGKTLAAVAILPADLA